MKWNNLTLSEKSELMKLYLKNGITSLSDMKEHYNSYATGGSIEDKDVPKYQTGGPDNDKIYISSQTQNSWTPEVTISANKPEWQRGLQPWDWSRAKQYYSNTDGTLTSKGFEFLKNVASKRQTGTSNFMRDVNKLSRIPNMAVGAIGAIPATAELVASLPVVAETAAPYVASILPKVPMAASRFLLGATGMEGTNQVIKENTDYDSWGDMLNQVLYGPNNNQINAEILEFSNPGSLLGCAFSRSNLNVVNTKEPIRYIKVKEPYLHSFDKHNIIDAIKSYRNFKNTDFNSTTFKPLKSAFAEQEKTYPLIFDKSVSSLQNIKLHTNPFSYWYKGPMESSFNPFKWKSEKNRAALAFGNDIYINPSMFIKSNPRYLKALVAHEYTHPFQDLYSKRGRLSVSVGDYYGANPDNPAYNYGLRDFYKAPTEWSKSPDEFQAEANFLKSYLNIPLTTPFKDLSTNYKNGFVKALSYKFGLPENTIYRNLENLSSGLYLNNGGNLKK